MRAQTRGLDAREAKLEALQQQLSESVAALVTGEDWKRALTLAAKFRSRSFNNTMLIYVQHYSAFTEGRVPESTPTYVAGFHQWLSLGRHVVKGQHGVRNSRVGHRQVRLQEPIGRGVMAASLAR